MTGMDRKRCRDQGGALRRARVPGALRRDPRARPILLELRRRVELRAQALVATIQSLLDAWPPVGDSAAAPPRTRNMEEFP